MKKFWKSLFRGVASITLWPAPIKPKYPFYKTDDEAIAADWKAIALDLDIAIAKVEDAIHTKQQEEENGRKN